MLIFSRRTNESIIIQTSKQDSYAYGIQSPFVTGLLSVGFSRGNVLS